MSTELNIRNKLIIGNVKLNSCIVLAPMAGFTDTVLRNLVRSYSSDSLLMSEMVSSEALKYCKKNPILDHHKNEFPLTFQISGHKPELMAEGARKLEEISTIIDINMGCPAPKIVKNFDGARLMTNLPLASSIITSVKQAVRVPVTVKCRLGWDCNSVNHVQFAKMAEESGADALIVHGRTRSRMYSGTADWNAIKEVKNAVKIPVIANGDITSPEKARNCIDITGCDGLAVGRGILGDPGLISRIEKYFSSNIIEEPPDIETCIKTALLHCKKQVEYRGEDAGIRYMRKFFAYYIRNARNAAKYRFELVQCSTLDEVKTVFDRFKDDMKPEFSEKIYD